MKPPSLRLLESKKRFDCGRKKVAAFKLSRARVHPWMLSAPIACQTRTELSLTRSAQECLVRTPSSGVSCTPLLTVLGGVRIRHLIH